MVGRGTTFTVRIPVAAAAADRRHQVTTAWSLRRPAETLWFDTGVEDDSRTGSSSVVPESRAPHLHPRLLRPAGVREGAAAPHPRVRRRDLNALNLEFGFWANVGFLAGGIVLALGAVGLLNVGADSRSSRTAADRDPEMLVFLLVPSVLPLLRRADERRGDAARQRGAPRHRVPRVRLRGALDRRVGGPRFLALFAASLSVLVRALSLLLFFLLVIFFTTETWQIWTVPAVPKFVAAGGCSCCWRPGSCSACPAACATSNGRRRSTAGSSAGRSGSTSRSSCS